MIKNAEYFKDILGYEGYYQVSNLGRIKSLGRAIKYPNNKVRNVKEKLLSLRKDTKGYLYVTLCKDGIQKTIRIHKIMQITFTDKFNQNKPCIDHIDRDRTNNHIDNLRECTIQENSRNTPNIQNSKSKYRGVTYINPKKYRANIKIDGQIYYLGYYKTELESAIIYDKACKYHFKEFGNLNFPNDHTIIATSVDDIRSSIITRKSSNHIGISFNNRINKWNARIKVDNKRKWLGNFKTEIEAIKAYDEYSKLIGGNK